MSKVYPFLLFSACLFGWTVRLSAAYTVALSCPDFTDITASYVEAEYGNTYNPFASQGVVDGRHTLITAQGQDPYTGNALNFLPPDENRVVRLGNEQVGAEAEALTYHFVVSKDYPMLLLKFAIVVQDVGHIAAAQPRFVVRVMDKNGHLTEHCAEYSVTASEGIPGFQSYSYGGVPIRWRDWTNVGLDLSPHIGNEVSVQLVTYDCAQYGHFGYAYFTASCIANNLQMEGCTEGQYTAIAPDNFAAYLWDDGGTARASTRTAPTDSENLSCLVTSAIGCSFTLTGYVTSSPVYQPPSIVDTICEGDPYNRNHFSLPPLHEAGTKSYYNSIMSLASCTSVQTTELSLTVLPHYYKVKASICEGNDYTAHGFDIRQPLAGVWRDTLRRSVTVGSVRCDSVICLELTVNASFNMPNTIYGPSSPCSGEPVTYSFGGDDHLERFNWQLPDNAQIVSGMGTPLLTLYFTDDTPGILMLTGVNGCGTGATPLEVYPRQAYNFFFTDTVCTGASYSKHDFHLGVQREPGYFVHIHRYAAAQGCDSVVTLALTVVPTPGVSIVVQGDSALCSGAQSATLHAVGDGVPFDLSALQGGNDSSFIYIHDCSLSYLWSTGSADASITVSPSATTEYSVTAITSAGCAATAAATVVVANATSQAIINASICEGETYSQFGFRESVTGTYATSALSGECTVPLTLNLTVIPISKDTIRDTICEGVTWTKHGFNITLYEAGMTTQTFRYTAHTGCDSLVTLALLVRPAPTTVLSDTVCQGSPYAKHGFSLSAEDNIVAGRHSHTRRYTSWQECDSVVVLNLTVSPTYNTVISDKAIVGELYNKYGFSYIPIATGMAEKMQLLQTLTCHCDSMVMLNLKVTCPVIETVLYDTICHGEAYSQSGFSLPVQVTSGTFTHQLTYSIGVMECDSIVTLHLTVSETIRFTVVNPIACADQPEIAVEVAYEFGRENFPIRYSLAFGATQNFFADIADAPMPARIPMPANIHPDVYSAMLTLSDRNCCVATQPFSITICYPASIIEQKWNNVVALNNHLYNGGREFTAYQWLENGEEIYGATLPYLYSPPTLNFTAGYSVRITRTDGVILLTCPFFPQARNENAGMYRAIVSVYPTIVDRGGSLMITSTQQGEAVIINILGAVTGRQKFSVGATSIAIPGEAGMYFVELNISGEQPKTVKILVK